MWLAWAVVVGIGGIIVYAEMSGRVARWPDGRRSTSSGATRPRMGLANLAASFSSTS